MEALGPEEVRLWKLVMLLWTTKTKAWTFKNRFWKPKMLLCNLKMKLWPLNKGLRRLYERGLGTEKWISKPEK